MSAKLSILLLGLMLSLPARAAEGDDVKDISLLTTRTYDPRDEQGRGLKAFFSGIGVAIAGPGKDLKKEILDKMNQEALKRYFPDPAERNQIAQRIAEGMKSRYLQNGYNNKNILGALRFATSEMVVAVLKRVLEKEGLKDSKRAGLWSNKILASYHACMNVARTYTEGGKCGSAVEADLIKNMGLAMSYELTRQEFGPDLAKPRPREFTICVKAAHPGANERVKNCALQCVKNAAKTFGRARVLEVAKKEVNSATAEKIVRKVAPAFERCLDTSQERTGFVKCGDQLIASAGSELAAEAILIDSRVSAFFPKAEDRSRIAASGRDAFARCMAENEKNKLRDDKGTLRTDNCVQFVKMETARVVASEVLRATVEKNMTGASAEEKKRVIKDSTETLARCWNSNKPEKDNATCARSAAKRVAVSIAREKLGRELPKDIQEQDPAFRDRLVASFEKCLESRLPANLFAASNADAIAEGCATEIYKDAALRIAEVKVRAALAKVSDQLPSSSSMDSLIDSFVKKAFADCLGDKPDHARVESCSLKLQKNVAFSIVQALLPFKVDEFFRNGGSLEAYGMNQDKRELLLSEVIEGNKTCLRKTVKSLKAEESEREINDCIKLTIRDLSLRLGTLELERMSKANGIDVASSAFAELKNSFAAEFGACLDEKKQNSFALDDYLKNLEPCQAKITKSLTVKIAKVELAKVMGEVFSDSANNSEREKMEEKLLTSFDLCMDKAVDSTARGECVKKLKGAATLALARAGTESRAIKDLGEIPGELKEYARELEHCSSSGKAPEDCARNYIKASSIVLGKKILHKNMKEQLGAGYEAIQPKLKPLEEKFETCVNEITGPIDKKLLSSLEDCGRKLADEALDVAINGLGDTAPTPPEAVPAGATVRPGKSTTDKELAEMMSRAVLCLNGQLSPETENSLDSLEPESMEAELMKLVGSYVTYDLKAAHGNVEQALAKVSEDLKAAGPESARRKLLDELVKGGLVDQLLRAVIRNELERSLQALPELQRPPAGLTAALLDKATLERALTPEVLEKVRPLMATGVLEPVLVDGKTLKSSPVLRALRSIKTQSLQVLLTSPELNQWKDDPALHRLRESAGMP